DIDSKHTVLTVALHGILDQNATLPPLNLRGIETIVFDFKGIEGINSFGIRDWLKYLRLLPATDLRFVYRNCRPQIVDQISMVQGFCLESTSIESFYAIYSNPLCKKDCEVEVLVNAKEDGLPQMVCKEWGQTMEPEEA